MICETKQPVVCNVCCNMFESIDSKGRSRKFCSKKCSGKAKRKRIFIKCAFCHIDLELRPSDVRLSQKDKFCSRTCYDMMQRKQGELTSTCVKCNLEKPLSEFHLKNKQSSLYDCYCKDCRRSIGREKSKRSHDRFVRSKWTAIHRRNLDWSLLEEEFENLIGLCCHYCDGPLEFSGVGLDRKDNSLGYAIDNVVSCCRKCNVIKNNWFSYHEMKMLSPALREIRESRKLTPLISESE